MLDIEVGICRQPLLSVGIYQNDLTLYEVTECLLREEEDGRVVKSPDPTDSVGRGHTNSHSQILHCDFTSLEISISTPEGGMNVKGTARTV